MRRAMYWIFGRNDLCNIPAFFYPTTILLIDDDKQFLDKIVSVLSRHYKTVALNDPKEAVDFLTQKEGRSFFRGQKLSKKLHEDILSLRLETEDKRRFDDILISVIDYDMPNTSGFDVMKQVGLSDYYRKNEHLYILLTAKRASEFDKELAEDVVGREYISKYDVNHLEMLLTRIAQHTTLMYQKLSHEIATILAKDEREQTSFLNDGNFLPIFNTYLKEHDICEGYLFDRQGSLMLLDNQANFHWLFVRNEKGIANSIAMAKQYDAPEFIIDKLKSKEYILSLYEKNDFEKKSPIDWEKYLLKATLFKDEPLLEVFDHRPSDYYYAFTQYFPNADIKKDKILSYADFLEKKQI